MTSKPAITFYDIISNEPLRCWSPNTWKTRLVLNIKNIPYKTEWVEYPDIKNTIEKLGVEANDKEPYYTLPVITDNSTGKSIMDSIAIAQYLEKLYPQPSLYLDSPNLAKLDEIKEGLFPVFKYTVMSRVVDRPGCLTKVSGEYFTETRCRWLNVSSLAEFEEEGLKESKAWERVEKPIRSLSEMLRAKRGPFVEGDKVSFVDIFIASYLAWAKVANEETFDRVLDIGGEPLKKLWKAMGLYLERNSY